MYINNNNFFIVLIITFIQQINFNYCFIGDWGLGIGDWAQSPIPNPQSPTLY